MTSKNWNRTFMRTSSPDHSDASRCTTKPSFHYGIGQQRYDSQCNNRKRRQSHTSVDVWGGWSGAKQRTARTPGSVSGPGSKRRPRLKQALVRCPPAGGHRANSIGPLRSDLNNWTCRQPLLLGILFARRLGAFVRWPVDPITSGTASSCNQVTWKGARISCTTKYLIKSHASGTVDLGPQLDAWVGTWQQQKQ
jgi:hypothetical protein